MHPPHIRASLIIALSLTGSSAVLALLIIITGALTIHTKTARHLLPAEQTVLLLSHPSQQDIVTMSHWFPSLKDLELPEQAESLAIVEMPNGSQEIAIFTRKHAALPAAFSERGGTMQMPPYVVLTSSLQIAELFAHGMTLAKDSAFIELSGRHDIEQPWAYARSHILPEPKSIADTLLHTMFIESTHALSWARDEDAIEVHFIARKSDTKSPKVHPLYLEQSILSLHQRDTHALIQTLIQTMPDETQALLEAILLARIHNAFGTDASWNYDLLPLMADATTLEINTTSSGAHIVLQVPANRETAGIIQRLQKSLIAHLQQTEVRSRSLDGRFASVNIRMAEKKIPDPVTIGNWQVQQIGNAAPLLITALQDDTYIISNTDDILAALKQHGHRKPVVPSISAPYRGLQAHGTTDLQKLETALRALLPKQDVSSIIPYPPDATVQWSLRQEGEVRTLRIERGNKGLGQQVAMR